MTRKTRQIKAEEAAELLEISIEEFKKLVEDGIIKHSPGRKNDNFTWPKIKKDYRDHCIEVSKLKNKGIKAGDYEWIRAQEAADRIAMSGCNKIQIGIAAKEGKLTRDEITKTYPWPLVKKEWLSISEEKQQRQERVTNSEMRISDEEVTDTFTTENLIKMIQDGVKGADTKAYQWARALNEIIKSRQGQLKLREAEGKTLDIADVEKWVYNVSRQNKEFWMQWPDRVAVKMGEELGIESRELCSVLKKYVRQNLDRIATLPDGYESDPMEGSH